MILNLPPLNGGESVAKLVEIGQALGKHWASIGQALGKHWASFGRAFGRAILFLLLLVGLEKPPKAPKSRGSNRQRPHTKGALERPTIINQLAATVQRGLG